MVLHTTLCGAAIPYDLLMQVVHLAHLPGVVIPLPNFSVEIVLFRQGFPLFEQDEAVVRVVGVEPDEEDRGIFHGFPRGIDGAGELPRDDFAVFVPQEIQLQILGLFRLLTEGDEGIFRHDGIGVAEYQDLAIFPLHIVMQTGCFINVLQSPQPDRRMRGRVDLPHHNPHIMLLQCVPLILHHAESAVQMIVFRFIPHFVKREIDVAIPQFPDVEFAVDGLSFGL